MGMSERIDRVLDDLVKSGAAPGVVAMVVNDRGSLYSGAAGTKGVGRTEPMTVDTMFWYASMTKALVAAGAMQLVEQGRLKLDEPASNLLPELASVQVLDGFDADGAPKLRPAKRPITPRQLLTHTAGYRYNWANGIILRYLEKYELPDLIHCKRRSLEQPLLADPGDCWEYGISIDWIGQLIEKVSGQSLRNYLRKNLFDPLGMDDTDFIQTATNSIRTQRVDDTMKIAVLPGDGIGKEVTAQAVRVLEATLGNSVSYELKEAPIGGAGLEAVGNALPPETLELARASDAILLGGTGVIEDEKRPPSEGAGNGLLRLRKALTLFANYRPIFLFPELEDASSLKRSVVSGVDILMLRELNGDLYFGEPRGIETNAAGERSGVNTMRYSESEIERIMYVAFREARKTAQGLLDGQIECARNDGALARGRDARRKVLSRRRANPPLRRCGCHAPRARSPSVRRHGDGQCVRRHSLRRRRDAHRFDRDAPLGLPWRQQEGALRAGPWHRA